MDNDPKAPNVSHLLRDLKHNEELRHQSVAASGLDPALVLLRTWQSERLAQTYVDLANDKSYRAACLFFLSDIYAPRDFSQRNHDIERVYGFLSRVVPAPMLQLLTDVIELNNLTDKLDGELLHALVDKLNMTDHLTTELYAEGYRICDNYVERVRQIDLISKVVTQVGEGAHLIAVNLALKMLRGPAYGAGWTELYDFLVRGYDAFKQMRDVKVFVDTIHQRELRILDQIYAGDSTPFTG
jgi:hypothetical protein